MTENSDFLYPFIDGGEVAIDELLVDLAESARAKAERSRQLQLDTLACLDAELDSTADAMAQRFATGGRLLTFGNGGSSTDAFGLATLFTHPPTGAALPARCLVEDTAVLTALGNDVGFDLVFARQIIAHGRGEDIAFGLSTSGNSRNLLVAFGEARRRGMLTVGLAGYDGGEMAASDLVDHCLVVHGDSVHRIQETQAALGCALWRAVQDRCSERMVNG
ncbi:MAG: SIS domain-containing protein [Acidimicrobiales bacterium]